MELKRRSRRVDGSIAKRIRRILVAIVLVVPYTSFAATGTQRSGRALYLENCAHCHGATARGDGPEAISFVPPPRDLRTGFLGSFDEDELIARLRDGTPLKLEFDPEALRKRVRQVELLTAHLQRLPSIDWEAVDEGNAIFIERCAICHGLFGKPWPPTFLPEGVQKPPRDLWDPEFQRRTSDDELVAVMQHGKDSMPGIPRLQDEAQARKLIPFLRVLSPGFELYSYYCAVCHGDDGRAEIVMAPDEYKPHVKLDRAWLARKDPDQLRVDVTHMLSAQGGGMPHFREVLSDEELRSIFRYLKSGE